MTATLFNKNQFLDRIGFRNLAANRIAVNKQMFKIH